MHVPGHIKNSLFRIGRPFDKQVGILHPVYTGKKYRDKTFLHPIWVDGKLSENNERILDFPILFHNNKKVNLHFGQKVAFLPYLVSNTPKGKWLVALGDIWDFEAHERAEGNEESDKGKLMIQQHAAYEDTDSFKIIYRGANPNNLKTLPKVYREKELRTDNEVIEWLVENTVSFDDMNLATN
jgi:hypothetical protein